MSEASRLPLRMVVLAFVAAFLAATATYVVLSGDSGDDGDASASAPTIELDPEPGEPTGEDVSFTTFEGDVVQLSSLHGRPLLVNFFASTCVPCIREMPALEEVYQEVGEEVAFLGLAMQDRPEDALELIERTGVTYPTAQDKDGSVITALGGTMLPTTVLLDAHGEVVAAHIGELEAGELRQLLADELGIAT